VDVELFLDELDQLKANPRRSLLGKKKSVTNERVHQFLQQTQSQYAMAA